MTRKNIIQMTILFLLGMGVLYSMIAFDHPGLNKEPSLLELSVILRDTDGSSWSAARQGMEQAALDWGAVLRILTLTTKNNPYEQQRLVAHEIENGADGILLVPADPDALTDTVNAFASQLPIVTLESDMILENPSTCIIADNAAIGETLGRMAMNGVPAGGTTLLLNNVSSQSSGITKRMESASRVLRDAGRKVIQCSTYKTSTIAESLESAFADGPPNALLAFEPVVLEEAAQFLQSIPENRPLLYGMGSSSRIAFGLEQGDITGIVAQNEYAVGYLAVEAAASAALQQNIRVFPEITFSIIRQNNMYYTDNQELLFPMTR